MRKEMEKVFHQQGWKIDMTFITHCLLLNEKIFALLEKREERIHKNHPSIHSYYEIFFFLIWYVSKAPEARSQKSWVIGRDEGTLESIQIFKVFWGGAFLILSSECHHYSASWDS